MDLRGDWPSVCPVLIRNPRRSQVAPIDYSNHQTRLPVNKFRILRYRAASVTKAILTMPAFCASASTSVTLS